MYFYPVIGPFYGKPICKNLVIKFQLILYLHAWKFVFTHIMQNLFGLLVCITVLKYWLVTVPQGYSGSLCFSVVFKSHILLLVTEDHVFTLTQ